MLLFLLFKCNKHGTLCCAKEEVGLKTDILAQEALHHTRLHNMYF